MKTSLIHLMLIAFIATILPSCASDSRPTADQISGLNTIAEDYAADKGIAKSPEFTVIQKLANLFFPAPAVQVLPAAPSGKAVTPATTMMRPIDALSDMTVPDEWLQLCPEDRTIEISSRWSGGQTIRVVTVSSCPLLIVRIHVRSGPVQSVHPSGSQATLRYGLLPYFRSLSNC